MLPLADVHPVDDELWHAVTPEVHILKDTTRGSFAVGRARRAWHDTGSCSTWAVGCRLVSEKVITIAILCIDVGRHTSSLHAGSRAQLSIFQALSRRAIPQCSAAEYSVCAVIRKPEVRRQLLHSTHYDGFWDIAKSDSAGWHRVSAHSSQLTPCSVARQVGPDEVRSNALVEALAQLARRAAFNQLRTAEQLGYIVFLSAWSVELVRSLVRTTRLGSCHTASRNAGSAASSMRSCNIRSPSPGRCLVSRGVCELTGLFYQSTNHGSSYHAPPSQNNDTAAVLSHSAQHDLYAPEARQGLLLA